MSAYKCLNNISPLYMSDIFIPQKVLKITRNSTHRFQMPFRRTNIGQKGMSYFGPKLWNNLPTELKLSKSTNLFKHKIKDMFFEIL